MARGVDNRTRWRATLAGTLVAATAVLLYAAGPSRAAAQADGSESTTPSTLLPTVSLPPVTLPPVSLPLVTVPPVTVLPSVTVPPVTLPPFLQSLTTSPPTTAAPSSTTSAPAGIPVAPVSSLPPVEQAAVPPSRGPAPGGGATTPVAGAGRPDADPLPVRLRLAATRTAERLSFPLGLAAAILAFLLVEPHIHRGDRRGFDNGGNGRDDELLGFS